MDSTQAGGELPLPQSMSEVEALIHQLYQPGNQHNVGRIQETLQRLQRSAEGWQMANSLLQSDDEKVQFFGALTFIVKLNSDAQSLSEEDAKGLVQRLLSWLLEQLSRSTGPLVVRKLCSALVTYFIHFSHLWPRCIRHVVVSMYANQAVALDALQDAPDAAAIIRELSPAKLLVVLWFTSAFVEEISRTDSRSMKTAKFHDRLMENVEDATALISTGLAMADNEKICQESLRCLQSWINYSHRAFIDEGIVLQPLKSLTPTAISYLTHPAMYSVTVELFSDVLANYSRYFDTEDFKLIFQILNSDWGQEKYAQLVGGDFGFESTQFGQLMLAYGDATLDDLVHKVDPASQQFVTALGGLLTAEGYAVAEDQIFIPALEFWATFVEVMIDALYSLEGSDPSWMEVPRSHVMRAIENCWKKIQFPPHDEFMGWDSTERVGFNDARKDVADLLQSSYTLTGPPLLSMFAGLTIQSLQKQAWPELEASLFCLGSMADCRAHDQSTDNILDDVFTTDIFNVLTNPGVEVLPRTRQSALWMVDQYSEYFHRRPGCLPSALNFLFQSVDTPLLAPAASRSIYSLCVACRGELVPQLSAFLEQYEKSLNNARMDGVVKERVLGAIAAIIEALPSETDKIEPLQQLFRFIARDVDQCLEYAALGDMEPAEESGVQALRSLTSIARALQSRREQRIDLDGPSNSSTLWTLGAGAPVQAQIQKLIVAVVTAVPGSGEIVDTACSVFRAGLREDDGPCALPPNIAVQFILRANINTARLGSVMSLASSVVSCQAVRPDANSQQLLSELLDWVVSLLRTLQEPGDDPEIAQNGIEFAYRLMPKYVSVLLHQHPAAAEFLFMFSLRTLTGRDPLPKAAAADFWTAFLSLSDQPDDVQASINALLDNVGPLLAEALMYNIGGNAARSELHKQGEPLKKLITRHVRAKQWLEAGLVKSVHSDRVSDSDKRTFLQKLLNLRGARGTSELVRDFWLSCRGSSFAYAP